MYISIRVTLDPSHNRTLKKVIQMFKAHIRYLEKDSPHILSGYTAGFERLNKYGEPIAPHIHFNFQAEYMDLLNPKRSVRSWFQKYAEQHEFKLVGVASWTVQVFEEPQDPGRWYRYPLKENPIPELCNYVCANDPSNNPCSISCILAKDERLRSIEANIIAREKARNKIQLKDKLFKFLDDSVDPSTPDKNIRKVVWTTIVLWYQNEGKPINLSTCDGYTNLYLLHIGHLTREDAFEIHQNNLKIS